MFISKVEKLKLISSMMDLTATIQQMDSEIIFLKARIKVLETKKIKVKKPLTEEQRIKQREYAKLYKARKLQEKQNATSISTESI
jgi:uncharacterized protein YaiL (DUF2058 family)